jgi:hypothetical protein
MGQQLKLVQRSNSRGVEPNRSKRCGLSSTRSEASEDRKFSKATDTRCRDQPFSEAFVDRIGAASRGRKLENGSGGFGSR